MDDKSSENEGVETEALIIRRSTRVQRPPVAYSPLANFLFLVENGEPESYPEALRIKESIQWKKTIEEELSSFNTNHIWSLVKLLARKKELQKKLGVSD